MVYDPAVAVVVVHYRCLDDTLACVASVREHAPEATVVVVENASQDGSGEALRQAIGKTPGVRLIDIPTNVGFGGGCNAGIDHALQAWPELQHVLLLNPDARVTASTIDELRHTAAAHPDAGIVGGLIRDLDGDRILYENGHRNVCTLRGSHAPAPAGLEEYAAGFITGTLMLIDAGLLRAGVRFDVDYFLYVEDADLCRQVEARGRTLWITRRSVALHREGGSQSSEPAAYVGMRRRQLRYITRNKVRFARRWLTLGERLRFYVTAFVVKPLGGIVRFGSLRFLGVYYGALLEGLRMDVDRGA